MLRYCSSVTQLVLPAETKVDSEKLRIAVKYMTNLKKLETQVCTDIKPLLQIVGLAELTLHVPSYCHHTCVSWVRVWAENAFLPCNLILITEQFNIETEKKILVFLLKFTYIPPLGYMSYFTVWYDFKMPLNLFPSFPEFQVEINSKIILSCSKARNFGLLGIGWDVCILSERICDGKPLYRAKIGPQSVFDIVHCKNIPMQCKVLSTFHEVIEFDFAYSEDLHSGHLEQLAIACPKLQRLNLQYNLECLRNLQGLRTIADHCKNLCGLNLTCIPIANVQSQIALWGILADMKLTYLVIHVCFFHPVINSASYEQQMIELFQTCSRVQALQLDDYLSDHMCQECNKCDVSWSLLSYFLSLKYCALVGNYSDFVQNVINSCKEAMILMLHSSKSLNLSSCIHTSNLQQLSVQSERTHIPATFLEAVSSHGRLLHVVFSSHGISVQGIGNLILNSPKLLTLNIYAYQFNCDQHGLLTVSSFKSTLKKRCPGRKVFTVGRLIVKHHYLITCNSVLGTDLYSLWPYCDPLMQL